MLGEYLGGSFPECGNAFRFPALEQRVEAQFDPGPDLACALARNRQRYLRCAAQTEIAAIAVLLHPDHPALRAGGLHHEVKPVAIA